MFGEDDQPDSFEGKRKKRKVQNPSYVCPSEPEDRDRLDEAIGSTENIPGSFSVPKCQPEYVEGDAQAIERERNAEEEMDLEDILMCPLCQLVFPTHLLLKSHKKQCYSKKYWKAVREEKIQPFHTPHHEKTISDSNVTDNTKCFDHDDDGGGASSFDNDPQEDSINTTPEGSSVKRNQSEFQTDKQKQMKEKLSELRDSNKASNQRRCRAVGLKSGSVKNIFECSECGHVFKRKSEILSHMRIHTGEKPFQCGECGMAFHQFGTLHEHMKTHMKERPFKCLECGKGFIRSKNLVAHMRSHFDDMPFQCDQCGMIFRQDIDLLYHKRSHRDSSEKSDESKGNGPVHMSTPTAEKPYQCNVCGKLYTWNGHLLRHMRIHEGANPDGSMQSFEEEAIQRGESSESLDYVIGVHHRLMETYLKEKIHEFNDNGERHLDEGTEKHSDVHIRDNSVTCDDDVKKIILAGNDPPSQARPLGRKKPYSCSECEKTFCHSGGLNVHMRSHTGQRPFECNECGRGFSRKGDLQMHVRLHTGEKPFECDKCGKCFHHSGNYYKHMRTHTGEKPYECDKCKRSFNQSGALQVHMRIHTGEKPYRCDECGETFSRNSHLHRHKKTHTGERPHSCTECGKGFAQRSNLYKHLRTHT